MVCVYSHIDKVSNLIFPVLKPAAIMFTDCPSGAGVMAKQFIKSEHSMRAISLPLIVCRARRLLFIATKNKRRKIIFSHWLTQTSQTFHPLHEHPSHAIDSSVTWLTHYVLRHANTRFVNARRSQVNRLKFALLMYIYITPQSISRRELASVAEVADKTQSIK